VIVTVVAVGPGMNMVQPAIDKIIDMIAVRHRFVAAVGPMNMAADQCGGAAIGIGRRHGDHMFINMIAMDMMQMAIMEIIDMAIMADGRVATSGPVNVGMIVVDMAAHMLAPPELAAGSPGDGCPHLLATA
jgi:hypothetical protein